MKLERKLCGEVREVENRSDWGSQYDNPGELAREPNRVRLARDLLQLVEDLAARILEGARGRCSGGWEKVVSKDENQGAGEEVERVTAEGSEYVDMRMSGRYAMKVAEEVQPERSSSLREAPKPGQVVGLVESPGSGTA